MASDLNVYVLAASLLLSGLNIVVLFNAARKFGALELMVQTMWQSFINGQFVHPPSGIAHDEETPHGDGQ